MAALQYIPKAYQASLSAAINSHMQRHPGDYLGAVRYAETSLYANASDGARRRYPDAGAYARNIYGAGYDQFVQEYTRPYYEGQAAKQAQADSQAALERAKQQQRELQQRQDQARREAAARQAEAARLARIAEQRRVFNENQAGLESTNLRSDDPNVNPAANTPTTEDVPFAEGGLASRVMGGSAQQNVATGALDRRRKRGLSTSLGINV